MESWQLTTSPAHGTRLCAHNAGLIPGFRVVIVSDVTGNRESVGDFEEEAAYNLADWFGRQGPLRAEVERLDVDAGSTSASRARTG
jgi:hypothetical protein